MPLDPARAALVSQERRYKIYEDASIKARFPAAQEIVIDTNLNATDANTMAIAVFNAASGFVCTFEFDVEGVLTLDDWAGGAKRYTVNFPRHPAASTSATYTLIGAKIDYFNNLTTLTVRG